MGIDFKQWENELILNSQYLLTIWTDIKSYIRANGLQLTKENIEIIKDDLQFYGNEKEVAARREVIADFEKRLECLEVPAN